jgi:hypothetical protein
MVATRARSWTRQQRVTISASPDNYLHTSAPRRRVAVTAPAKGPATRRPLKIHYTKQHDIICQNQA